MFGSKNGKTPAPQGMAIPPQPEGCIRMVIDFNPENDGCQVSGPLLRPSICYQMLEMARDVVHGVAQQNQAKKTSLTIPPPGFDPTKPPLRPN